MSKGARSDNMDLLAKAMRRVHAETFGDAPEHASDDAQLTDNETTENDAQPQAAAS